MPGELIVRIFLYGLIIVVPHNNDTPNDPTDDTLVAYLVNAPHHDPLLRYCEEFKKDEPQVCEKEMGTPEPLKGWSVSFEFKKSAEAAVEPTTGTGDQLLPSAALATRRYYCDPVKRPQGQGVSRCDRNGPPPMHGHPSAADNGGDFDWVAKLSEVLDNPGRLDTSPRNFYAIAEFDQGTVSVCEFVKVRSKCVEEQGSDDFVVPLVEFKNSSKPFSKRAIASSLVVEMVGDKAEDFVVQLQKLGQTNPTVIIPDRRPCRDHGRQQDSCIELSITNLPNPPLAQVACGPDIEKNIEMLKGDHWKYYQKLLSSMQPEFIPRPVAATRRNQYPPPSHVAPACPVFPQHGLDKANFWPGPLSKVVTFSTEDRPICPIGTP